MVKNTHLIIDDGYDAPLDVQKTHLEGPLFVYVFMHGCPYCEIMMPEWGNLRKKNKINTIMINHLKLDDLKKQDSSLKHINPQMFPYLELIPDKSKNKGIEYNGPRNVQNFLEFIDSNMKNSAKKESVSPKKKEYVSSKKKESVLPKKKESVLPKKKESVSSKKKKSVSPPK